MQRIKGSFGVDAQHELKFYWLTYLLRDTVCGDGCIPKRQYWQRLCIQHLH